MKRKEALKLIGMRVKAWTGLNGEYAGILVDVTSDRPWRGVVRIQEVLVYPAQGLSQTRPGWRSRRPFRENEEKQFGGINIFLHDGPVVSYQESVRTSLLGEIRKIEEIRERMLRENRLEWWVEPTLKSLQQAKEDLFTAPSADGTTIPN